MATGPLDRVLRDIRGAAARQEVGCLTDGDLLGLFLARRDEPSFAELVRRHGPMVLGVCRRVLRNSHDAEDAFQATFLILVRRAASVRPRDRVGSWLYGVAHRTALEARRAAARRRAREARAVPRPAAEEPPMPDFWPVLDQELRRLPDKYRAPLLLCDLEGKTRKEAAAQLGWPEGTVNSRLARARALLARRLLRRGVVVTGGAAALTGTAGAGSANVPPLWAKETVQAAVRLAAGSAAAGLPAPVAALMKGVLRTMWLTKMGMAALVLVGAVAVAGVLGVMTRRAPAAAQPGDSKAAAVADGPAVPARAGQEVARADEDKDEKPTYSVTKMPPVVVRTEPQAGDTQVDAKAVTEIRVTFSKKMMDRSWSWVQISDDTFPKVAGKAHYDKDRRTCVMPVKLEPRHTYVIWLNSEQYRNFKDADNRSAVPYLLVFETKADEPAKTCSVEGRVTYKGKPLAGGTVSFHPDQGKPVSARIQQDGSYAAEGVPVGTLRVTIQAAKGATIPRAYTDPRTSSLDYQTRPGKQTFDINLQ